MTRGTGCSLSDTLVYYLVDAANCDAAASWMYDPDFFEAVSVTSDAIHLVPKQRGLSTVKAFIEGNCSIMEQELTASVLISASEMSLGNDTIVCNNQELVINAGGGYNSYLWSDNSTDSTLSITSPGEYFVTVTDNCGHQHTDTILVADASTTFVLGGDSVSCNGNSVVLTATEHFTNYEWLPAHNITVNQNTAIVSPDTETTYIVSAISPAGCVVKDSLKISVVTTPPLTPGPDTTICEGERLTLQVSSDFDTYRWSTGSTSSSISISTAGTYTIEAMKNGCFIADSTKVSIQPLPIFTLGNDTTICDNEFVSRSFDIPGASYLWSTGNTSGTEKLLAGDYWLRITRQNCSSTDNIVINTRPAPVVFLGNDTILCENDEYVLHTGSQNARHTWQDGSVLPAFIVRQEGRYHVTVMENACSASDTIFIAYKAKPFFSLADTVICSGMEIELSPDVNTPVIYSWNNGSQNKFLQVNAPGIYGLTVSNECGTFNSSVSVVNGFCKLMMPDAFSPNNDGLNDWFRVKFPFPAKSFEFFIFNRLGERVFATNDMQKGWDGTYRGRSEPPGAFAWMIRYTDINGIPREASGTVILLR